MRRFLLTASAVAVLFCPAALAQYEVCVGPNGGPVQVAGSLSVSGAANATSPALTFNTNSQCAIVNVTGQPNAGFHLDAGTLTSTLTATLSSNATPSTSGCTGGTSCTCTGGTYPVSAKFVDGSGNTSASLVLASPNAEQQFGVTLLAGTVCMRVCTAGSGTTGAAANAFTQATAALSPSAAAGADVTDRAGRLLGMVSPSTNLIGKVGIDQTTPGTTNGVQLTGTVPLPTGAATAAKQPALGTIAVPSTDVISSVTPDTPGSATTLSAQCPTGLSCAANSTATFAFPGQQSATMTVSTSASPVGVLTVVDCFKDGGTAPILSGTPATSGLVGMQINDNVVYAINNPVVGSVYTLVPSGECIGASVFRFRNAGLTTGSIAVTPRASSQPLGSWNYIRGVPLRLGQQTQANSLPVTFSPDQGPLPLPILAAGGTQQSVVTLTTTTETAVSTGLGGGLFTDLTEFDCTNGGSTLTRVDLRDTTTGTVRKGWWLAPNGGGLSKPINPSAPVRSQTAGTGVSTTVGAWTVQLSASPTGNDVRCNVTAQQRVP